MSKTWEPACSVTMSSGVDHILVLFKTPGGEVKTATINVNVTLTEFKNVVQQLFGDISNYRFLIRGKSLDTCNETRFNEQKCLFHDNVVIQVVKRWKGGGCLGVDFVDLNNTAGLKRHEWSITAPKWRIATFGLCLEGKCDNKSCEAYKQQVIVPIGFGKFDLLKDPFDKSKCPICREYVDPITCAFSDCRWRWHGMKQNKPGTKPEKISKDWQIADCAYHIFDESISGTTRWLELVIESERR